MLLLLLGVECLLDVDLVGSGTDVVFGGCDVFVVGDVFAGVVLCVEVVVDVLVTVTLVREREVVRGGLVGLPLPGDVVGFTVTGTFTVSVVRSVVVIGCCGFVIVTFSICRRVVVLVWLITVVICLVLVVVRVVADS